MTHYYLYIAAGLTIDSNTRFYKVGIGESEAQNKKRAWLESYAYEHGHFFVRWSLDAVEFLARCLESVNKDLFDVLTMKADDMVGILNGSGEDPQWIWRGSSMDLARILNGSGEDPAFYQAAINRHHLLMQIDPNYYTCQMLKAKAK